MINGKIKIKIPERDILKAITNYLQFRENLGELYFVRTNSFAGQFKRKDGTYGWIKNNKAGCPDILICYKGKFIGLEAKSEKGIQDENQKKAEAKIKKAGGEYHIIRNLEDLEKILNLNL